MMEGSVGYDLISAYPSIIFPNKIAKIPLDIAMEFPEGTYGRIVARSSLASQFGLEILGGEVYFQIYFFKNDEFFRRNR